MDHTEGGDSKYIVLISNIIYIFQSRTVSVGSMKLVRTATVRLCFSAISNANLLSLSTPRWMLVKLGGS